MKINDTPKKLRFLYLLLVIISFNSSTFLGQSKVKHRFVEEGKEFLISQTIEGNTLPQYRRFKLGPIVFFCRNNNHKPMTRWWKVRFQEDTIINNEIFKKVILFNGHRKYSNRFVQEDNAQNIILLNKTGSKQILYHFNIDSIQKNHTLIKVDTIINMGIRRERYTFKKHSEKEELIIWVSGLGNMGDIIDLDIKNQKFSRVFKQSEVIPKVCKTKPILVRVMVNNKIIYLNENYKNRKLSKINKLLDKNSK